MRDAIQIARIFGIPIRLHWSWFLVLGLLTWTLAAGYFSTELPEGSGDHAWLYGLAAALLLFASVLLHELSHAVVARRADIPVSGITLHVFGGVAQLEREPASPGAEFRMAAVGPLTSFAIAAACWAAVRTWTLPAGWDALVMYLGRINLLVAAFNLVPGFPLDGGRLLRAALWAWRRDLIWATRIASTAGTVFGFALIAWGAARLFGGELVGGLWLMLIGMFLHQVASASYAQLVARRSLGRVPVHEAMTREVIAVPADATVAELVDRYFWPHHVASFPVVDGGGPGAALVGVVTIGQVKGVPREEWPSTRVADIMAALRDDLTIGPDASSWEALGKLNRNGVGRLAVVEAGRLVGYLSVRDVTHLLVLETAGGEGPVGRPAGPAPWRRLDRAA
jgi:Zn-dependent protease/predicted transcriptional regulator